MLSQAEIFADAIVGMKKALKRKAYDSDSDSSIEQLTNRGNKLRKKARFVHEGQLAPPSGPSVYKRTIEHAGFQREIISNNPIVVDEEGDEIASDDETEAAQAARISASEFDPYADIRIEQLLAPLTAASDLPDHPTLSKPFTSKTLTELTKHAGDMVQKELASLWRIKHLLTRLSGDDTWIPCESVETEHDFALFFDEPDQAQNLSKRVIARDEADHGSTGTMTSDDTDPTTKLLAMEAHAGDSVPENSKVGNDQDNNSNIEAADSAEQQNPASRAPLPNGKTSPISTLTSLSTARLEQLTGIKNMEIDEVHAGGESEALASLPADNPADSTGVDLMEIEPGLEDQEDLPIPTRMRTRAQAQAASDNTAASRTRSITPEAGNEGFIHPYFLAPPSSHPDRNLGLPQHEADETRRLLQLYIQKQEEVCRGAQKVYEGLLRADRCRKLVMKWAKAEAHVRDMSDGEDWYDKEEWGLDEDLKKGQDEEEEDAATTAKKTRTRRQ